MEKTMTEVCGYLNNYFWESKINFAKGYMEKCHSKLIERQKSIESERDDFYKRV